MKTIPRAIFIFAAAFAVTLISFLGPTSAQAAVQTWVSSTGSGVACTRAAPCASFAQALLVTDNQGVVSCVDYGDYGPVSIGISVAIDCDATGAAITQLSGGTAVFVNGSVRVTLRGLAIDGGGVSTKGIEAQTFTVLRIENCQVSGFKGGSKGVGILIAPQPGAFAPVVSISDTAVHDNGLAASGGGIVIEPQNSGPVSVSLNRVAAKNNTYGIFANGTNTTGAISLRVRDSVAAGNVQTGISAFTSDSHGAVGLVVDNSSSVDNNTGVLAQGGAAFVTLTNATVMSNQTGIANFGGNIWSYQNNQMTGNVSEGAAVTRPLAVQ
jgi:hypothetical protein